MINSIIEECYNTGAIQSSSSDGKVGGIAGYSDTGTPQIINCYNAGEVSGNSYSHSGGILGELAKGTVVNCHSYGTVTGETAAPIVGTGGNNDVVTNCYYLAESAENQNASAKAALSFMIALVPKASKSLISKKA